MATKLLFEASDTTPKISLDLSNCIFCFEGYSLPNNPFDFYKEVILKITTEVNKNQLNTFSLNFRLRYFNTASTKSFHELFKKLNEYSLENNVSFSISWNLDNDEDDVKETVLIFKDLFNNIPFTINENK